MKRKITVFLNGSSDISSELPYSKRMSLHDLIADCREALGVSSTSKCRLFDISGGELSDDDMEYINKGDVLFLTQGEELSTDSFLVIYEEVQFLGRGGFGDVKLFRHKFSLEEVAVKFIHMRRVTSPENITRVFKEI